MSILSLSIVGEISDASYLVNLYTGISDPLSCQDPNNSILWGIINQKENGKTNEMTWLKHQDNWIIDLLNATKLSKDDAVESKKIMIFFIYIKKKNTRQQKY